MNLLRYRLLLGVAAVVPLAACGSGDGGAVSVAASPGTIAVASAPTPTQTPAPTPAPTSTPAPVPVSTGTIIVQAGDSIGVGPDGYTAIDHLGFDQSVGVINVSFGGETMARGYEVRGYNEFARYDPTKTCVILIALGTNDLGTTGLSAGDLYNGIAVPYVASAKANGFYVALITVLPRTSNWSDAKEKQRLAYNNMVRQNSAGADAIVDWAADPVIGDGVDPSTSPLYADGLHPTVSGQQRLAVIDHAALAPLLGRTPRSLSGQTASAPAR